MKELYLCIYRQFDISLSETNFFSFSQQNTPLQNKLQKAFLFYKQQSGDNRIMFMQFCRNLQTIGKEYSAEQNNCGFVPLTKKYVFVCLMDMKLMTVRNGPSFSFICLEARFDKEAITLFQTYLQRDHGIETEKNRCKFYKEVCMTKNGVMAPSRSNKTSQNNFSLYFYSLSSSDYRKLVVKERQVKFVHLFDPMLLVDPTFYPVTIFVELIRKYAKSAKKVMGRKKSNSEPVRLGKILLESVDELERKERMEKRLEEFERGLDGILNKYGLKFKDC